jgi:hypothetical protein
MDQYLDYRQVLDAGFAAHRSGRGCVAIA